MLRGSYYIYSNNKRFADLSSTLILMLFSSILDSCVLNRFIKLMILRNIQDKDLWLNTKVFLFNTLHYCSETTI